MVVFGLDNSNVPINEVYQLQMARYIILAVTKRYGEF